MLFLKAFRSLVPLKQFKKVASAACRHDIIVEPHLSDNAVGFSTAAIWPVAGLHWADSLRLS